MKLTSEDTVNLSNIMATCAIGGIEAIIIEGGSIRGINESRTCAIISNKNIPAFPQNMGVSRLSALRQRLDLFSKSSDTIINAVESDRGEISSLEISAGRNKAQFRCTATMLIKAPREINDDDACRVFMDKEEAQLIMSAIKVMGTKTVQLTVKRDRNVTVILPDESNDAFTASLKSKSEQLGDDEMDSVVHYYTADIFSDVLRSQLGNDNISLDVGVIGTIKANVNGHILVMLPKINDDMEE